MPDLSDRLNPQRLMALMPFLALVAQTFAVRTPIHAQSAPGTDIWVLELGEAGGSPRVGHPVRVTDRSGYDNQPAFTPDGSLLLYTSIDDAGQADIWRYNWGTGRGENLTETAPESEYSAAVMPGGDRFSVIRVEADSTQRLWSFDAGGGDARVVLESVAPVGYHAWIDGNTLALFVLGSPATLQIAQVDVQSARVAASDIGRSLHRIPGQHLASFLQWETREGERVGIISSVDPASGRTEEIAEALQGSEDYAWTPGGVLLMGSGSTLYALDPTRGSEWRVIADLAPAGIQDITRLAVSPDGTRLAVVGGR